MLIHLPSISNSEQSKRKTLSNVKEIIINKS